MTDQTKQDDRASVQTLDVIAELGWEAHRAWEKIIGEPPSLTWDQLSPDRKRDLLDSVRYLIDHPITSVSTQHDHWRATRASQGWQAGEDRDVAQKLHPNMVSFDELPFSQQMKARLWRHIVFAVIG